MLSKMSVSTTPKPPETGTSLGTNSRTQAGLASSLRIAIARLNRRLRYEREDAALSLNQLSALGVLERHGPMPVGELAAHEKVRPPSMTRTVTYLEQLGLATREPHPTDRRLSVIRIAPAGLAHLATDRKSREAWLNLRLRELTPEEREQLRAVLPVLEKLVRS